MTPRSARAGACVALGALWIACGPVGAPPSSDVPVNACPPFDCAAYVEPLPLATANCSAGVCVTNSPIDFVFVVSLPESSFFAPGVTMAIPGRASSRRPPRRRRASRRRASRSPSSRATRDCSSSSRASASAPGIQQVLNDGRGATLPGDRAVLPALAVPRSERDGHGRLGRRDERRAAARARAGDDRHDDRARARPRSDGLPATTWRASLAPGSYERDVVPYDDAYPPLVDDVSTSALSSPGSSRASATTRSSGRIALQVTRSAGLAAFTAYIDSTATKRRISSLTTFGAGASGTAWLNTFDSLFTGGASPTGKKLEIVIAPPAGAPIPTFTDPIVARTVQRDVPRLARAGDGERPRCSRPTTRPSRWTRSSTTPPAPRGRSSRTRRRD